MSRRLAILGAGGHGRVVADAALAAGWDEVAMFDDATGPGRDDIWAVVGTSADLLDRPDRFAGVIVAIGANAARLRWHRRLTHAGARMTSVVHPHGWVSPRAAVGAGSVVCAGSVVQTGAMLGEAVIVNTGASVDHDCRLADGVHLSPGARLSGRVAVGEETWIGVGACVRQGVRIAEQVTVGAGAAVVSDVASFQTVVGVPARPLKR